jgi:hypothetical protein
MPSRSVPCTRHGRAIAENDQCTPGSRNAAGKHVIGVDMYAAFTSNPDYATAYMVDALHPNPAGYALLGQTWYTTILPYLR